MLRQFLNRVRDVIKRAAPGAMVLGAIVGAFILTKVASVASRAVAAVRNFAAQGAGQRILVDAGSGLLASGLALGLVAAKDKRLATRLAPLAVAGIVWAAGESKLMAGVSSVISKAQAALAKWVPQLQVAGGPAQLTAPIASGNVVQMQRAGGGNRWRPGGLDLAQPHARPHLTPQQIFGRSNSGDVFIG